MKFKTNLKRFLSMSRQTGGFTLVELIVVIAILAILAGVAIPAYSGYITKANEAADGQLLAAVNRAFAAACNSNGFSQYDVQDYGTGITVNENGTIKVGAANSYFNKVMLKNGTDEKSKMNESFASFFAGNDGAFFRIYRRFEFVNGEFKAVDSKGVSLNGETYYVSQEAVNNFKGSIFGSSEEMVAQLQSQVGSLAGAYGQIAGSMRPEDLEAMLGSDYADYIAASGATTATGTGNATVLYIAEQSANMNATDVYNQLAAAGSALGSNPNPSMSDFLNAAGQTGDPLSTAAMMYGAVTAYANSEQCTDHNLKNQVANVQSGTDLANLFAAAYGDAGFKNYVGQSEPSDAFTKDMNGYLGAMSGMNSVSGGLSSDINNENLWEDDAIDQLLKDMMG